MVRREPGRFLTPRQTCSVCGNEFSSRYLGQHRRVAHGIRGGLSGRVRRQPGEKKPSVVEVARAVEVASVKRTSFKVLPFVVLEDQDGAVWMAEKIRDA